MSNIAFIVPKLRDNNAWLDYRSQYPGGFGWRYDRNIANINYAVNHHSVTNPSWNAKADCDTVWNIHRGNGWGGIGYNFIITSEEVVGKDGLKYAKVAYVGDLGSVRAHTTNSKGAFGLPRDRGNEYLVAACMIGQLHIHNPTEAQIRSAYWLYRELIIEEPQRMPSLTRANIASGLTSHMDWDATACSGNWGWQKPQIVNYQDPPKIEKKTEVHVASIPYRKLSVPDASIPKGEERITQVGKDGSKNVFWEVTFTNGVETSRKILREEKVSEPVDEVLSIGTYVPEPEPEPHPEPTPDPNHFVLFLKWLIGTIISMLRRSK